MADEQVDHRAEAERLLAEAPPGAPTTSHGIAAAHVCALLAVADEMAALRTALVERSDVVPVPFVKSDNVARFVEARERQDAAKGRRT